MGGWQFSRGEAYHPLDALATAAERRMTMTEKNTNGTLSQLTTLLLDAWDYVDETCGAMSCKDCAAAPKGKTCETKLMAAYLLSKGVSLQTNADRLRSMSDAEIARLIDTFASCLFMCSRDNTVIPCVDCELHPFCSIAEGDAMEWLRQPAEGK